MRAERRVVVTGVGVANPIGIGIEDTWDALIEKRCGIRRIESFDPSGFPAQIGGELPPFKLGDLIPKYYRKSAKVMARDIMIAVLCAYRAVKDAGLKTKCIIDRGEASGPPNVDSTRFGANIGAGLICADLQELAGALNTAVDEERAFSLKRWGSEGMENLTPLWLLKFLPNMLACHVTIVHDAQAPSNTITCGEASSHLAIGEAYRTISRGDADVCMCGGAESKVNPMAMARPHLWRRLNNENNENPEEACQPFGIAARGGVVAEGGGLIVLEALDHARERGARIYAELVGFGASSTVHSWSEPDPRGRGITVALQKALADADTDVSAVDLVVPFGTGIADYDASEVAAWDSVLGSRLADVPALTTRGAMGINGAGTGGTDVAVTVQSLFQRTVPPSVNTADLDPACGFRFVQDDATDADIKQAITIGYALAGGQNAALVVRRYEE
jgi:3-oxoacyl-[acyl-carrier-protein] synthase II